MKKKYCVFSGLFEAISLAESPREAAIEAVQFLKGGEILDECFFVSPSGERAIGSNTYVFNTDKILNEYNTKLGV